TWTPVDIIKADSKGGATLTKQADGSLLLSGKNPLKDNYTIAAQTKLNGITALRLEVLPDASLAAKGPGRAPNGNFVLTELRLSFTAPSEKKAKPIALKNAQADFAQDGWAVAGAIDNNRATGWAIAPQFGQPHTAYFELATPLNLPSGAKLTVTMAQEFGSQHTLGRFRLSLTTSKTLSLKGPPAAIVKILGIEPAKRTPQQKAELTN
ncbi:MAG: PSD1 and planctomycete cytochrome C domain-containing protein, partial [Gemmataceae bacterium]